MKKYGLLFLVLCLGVTMLSGCDLIASKIPDLSLDILDQNADDTVDVTDTATATTTVAPVTEPTTAPTEAVDQPTVDLELLVTDAYYKKIDYYEELNSRDVTLEYAIPQINLDGEAIVAVNEEIMAYYQSIVDDELTAYEEGYSNICYSIAYEWTVNDDVLSLLITVKLDWAEPMPYRVYNVSISEARLLSAEEMYEIADLDADTIREMLGSYYFDMYGNLSPSDFGDYYYDQLENTLADENVQRAEIYLDENGGACVIGQVYSMAGADYYSYIIAVDGYVPNADYTAYAGTGTQTDTSVSSTPTSGGSYVDAYAQKVTSYPDGSSYVLYDIDQDGTPELLVTEKQTVHQVYTYSGGYAVYCGDIYAYVDGLYQSDTPGLIVHSGGQGHMHLEYIDKYTLVNMSLTSEPIINTEDYSYDAIDSYLSVFTPLSARHAVDDTVSLSLYG